MRAYERSLQATYSLDRVRGAQILLSRGTDYSFTLFFLILIVPCQTVSEMKSYAKPTGKYPPKKNASEPSKDTLNLVSVQSKLVLLTLSFPRLRVIWSSSPYASADIFGDLKTNHPEPDVVRAVAIGAEEDPEAGAGVNQAAEELLRALPGITAKNVKYVMSRVGSVKELCGLNLQAVQDILGNEPGKACWEFMHRGE